MSGNPEITLLLNAAEQGEETAAKRLLDVVYGELHKMAVGKMAQENRTHGLQPTLLVHDAYLKLFGHDDNPKSEGEEAKVWSHRGHFFAAAAEAMRRILIDNARKRTSQKRGGDIDFTTLNESKDQQIAPDNELLAVDEALSKLEEEDADLARVVKLRYFAGMSVPETATALGVSPRTVNRQWECARAWLYHEISEQG